MAMDDGGHSGSGPSGQGFTAVVERDVPVPMRDGTVLRADVWRPAGPGRFPVLLQRLPYDKSGSLTSQHYAGLEPLRAVGAGYAVVIEDTRGRFASGGTFRPFDQETADGADTVAWAAAQPFCDGRVGMYGASYFGATQLLAAVGRPAALRAIAPHLTAAEYYDGWSYQGGAFQLGFALLWALTSLAPEELRRRARAGEDTAALESALRELFADPWSAYRRLPLTDQPAIGALVPAYREWLAHPERDAYWRATAIDDRYDQIAVPALHIGGWYDIFLAGTLRNYAELRKRAAGARARAGQRLIVGPWAHAVPHDTVGEVTFGLDASQAALDLTAAHLRWFDAALADGPLDDEPRVRLFVMGVNRWRDEDGWPLARARSVPLYLRSGGRANSLRGDGVLSFEPPAADEPPDAFLYDPRRPVPTVGGSTFLPGLLTGLHAGPRDQRGVEERDDVLVYTTAPLPEDLEVTGPLRLVLHAASSAVDTDWTAKLVDVHPSGRALNLADGILRARYRQGLDAPAPLEPGRPYAFGVDLVATSNVFRAGHRIRVEVTSSNFPRFDRNPNTGGAVAAARESELVPALQRVFHDAARPSHLVLPIVPAA